MKILLSAYACEPNMGSEPSVGWNWALELSKLGHKVYVLTRTSNRKAIESELAKMVVMPNLEFIFFDLPAWAKKWKKGYQGIHVYYFLWQIGAFFKAHNYHKKIKFDMVHHVTFVSIRQPSFMGFLRIPFIFGPVAGGERAPWLLRRSFPLSGLIRDFMRDVQCFLIKLDPFMHLTFHQASCIYVTSKETYDVIPRIYHPKTKIQLAIGSETIPIALQDLKTHDTSLMQNFKILFVGRLVYLKGLHLGLKAFANLLKENINADFTIIGCGPQEAQLKNLSQKLSIQQSVKWIPWMQREQLVTMYGKYDLLLFPSLHDTGGAVILEGMSQGLPAICLDLGGPGMIVNNNCGRVIQTKGKSEQEIIEALKDALLEISTDKHLQLKLSKQAIERVKEFSWQRLVNTIYRKD